MSDSSYLFYDLETTGLNPAFDQILRFAAVRTDLSLNILDRHTIKVRLSPGVTPSPDAMLVHRISVEQMQQGVSAAEAATQIYDLVNHPGTLSLGYNSLGFDDEFLRFTFYQHLLPPYTHQYANQCGRADIYPITLLYFLYHRSGLSWPVIDGRPSLKLADLNEANQWVKGQAHDAAVDVEITLALSRVLQKNQKMWHYAMWCFNKHTENARIKVLPVMEFCNYRYGLMVDGRIGLDSNFLAPVIFLGAHQCYKNQTLWLRLDIPNICEKISKNALSGTAFILRRKQGEPAFLLPPKRQYLEKLKASQKENMQANKDWLTSHLDWLNETANYYCNLPYPDVFDVDVDAALYLDGFSSKADVALSAQFHQVNLEKKIELVSQIENPNLRERAIRFLGRYYPNALPDMYRDDYSYYLSRAMGNSTRLLKDLNGRSRLTPELARKSIKHYLQKQELDEGERQLLMGLEGYLTSTTAKQQYDIQTDKLGRG